MPHKVYRLRNLPGDVDVERATHLLSIALGDIAPGDIQIRSLAPTVDSWERVPTLTATLTLSGSPARLTDNAKGEWIIPALWLRKPLIVDTHFHGMTPLNATGPTNHTHDCIAIPGLGGHPFGSWQEHGSDKAFMWIRDTLPQCLLGFRFIIYGYDTTVQDSQSFQSIPDMATTFTEELKANGLGSPGSKPLIFMAHSLGGVLLKQSLLMLAGSGTRETFLLSRILGAVFFGVPSFGMANSELLAMVDAQPNKEVISDLSQDSDYLINLDRQFDGVSYIRMMKLFWAYETKQTPTVVDNATNGSYTRSGPPAVLVSRESATRRLCESNPSLTFQIDEDHSNIVKFTEADSRINIVADKLVEIAANSNTRDLVQGDLTRAASSIITHNILLDEQVPWLSESSRREGKSSSQYDIADSVSWDFDLVISALHTLDRDRRLEQIERVQGHTFEWVFEDYIGFSNWLRRGQGVFWISGKPGSGKSTFMKFIYNDPRTRELLERWNSSNHQVTVGFFFHHGGTALQRSFHGLLMSVVSQLLEKLPDLKATMWLLLAETYPEQKLLREKFQEKIRRRGLESIESDINNLLTSLGLNEIPKARAESHIEYIKQIKDGRPALRRLLMAKGKDWQELSTKKKRGVESALFDLKKNSEFFEENGLMRCGEHVKYIEETLRIPAHFELLRLTRDWKAAIDFKTHISRLLDEYHITDKDPKSKEQIRDIAAHFTKRQQAREEVQAAVLEQAWTRPLLETALIRILNQDRLPLEITLFLDAVDEYDGRPEFISDFLKDLCQESSSYSIRLCFSSRPWDTFVKEFGGCPGFKIHDHTKEDIRDYCLHALHVGSPEDQMVQELIPEIVNRARGVFLWVKFVLKDLFATARLTFSNDSQRLEHLWQKLEALPQELDAYYATIVARIPTAKRWNAYVILECISRSRVPLTAIEVMEIVQYSETDRTGGNQRIRTIVEQPSSQVESQLRATTGGLVEIYYTSDQLAGKQRVASSQVQLMHQTMKEFVEKPLFKDRVLGHRAKMTIENGHSFLARHRCFRPWDMEHAVDRLKRMAELIYHATKSEATTGTSQYPLFFDAPWSFRDIGIGRLTSAVGFATYAGLHLYLRDVFAAAPHQIRNCSDALFNTLLRSANIRLRKPSDIIETAKILVQYGVVATADEIALLLCHYHTPSEASPSSRTALSNAMTTAPPPQHEIKQACVHLVKLALNNHPNVDVIVSWWLCGEKLTGTVLHLSPLALVPHLLEMGANPNAQNSKGQTPLDRAVGDYALSRVLAQHGARLRSTSARAWRAWMTELEAAGQDTTAFATVLDVQTPRRRILSGVFSRITKER